MARLLTYRAESLVTFFRSKTIATMGELKTALGTSVDMTVFRKLREIAYHSSYSHRGRFYTLDELAKFDEQGLWGSHHVWFSRVGTLLATAKSFVESAQGGYFASELEGALHVGVKDALRTLVEREQIAREEAFGLYLYCSTDAQTRERQILHRRLQQETWGELGAVLAGDLTPDEVRAAIVLFYSLLDEQQRRLYAGLESLKRGHGGDTTVARLLGLDTSTVAKGRRQLLVGEVERGRVRQHGGGRKALEKKRPR